MDRGSEANRRVNARLAQLLDCLLARDDVPSFAGVMTEHAGWNQAHRWLRKTPQRLPDQIMRSHYAAKRLANQEIAADRAIRGVEHYKVGVLSRRLGEPAAEARIAQELLKLLRR